MGVSYSTCVIYTKTVMGQLNNEVNKVYRAFYAGGTFLYTINTQQYRKKEWAVLTKLR